MDKNSMHHDKVLCVLTQDPTNKNKNSPPSGNEKIDENTDVDTDNRITLMGCGKPGETKGLILKVVTHSFSVFHSHSFSCLSTALLFHTYILFNAFISY